MAIIQTVVAGGGTTPTGTKNITTNGTHDVAAYEYADVQVPTTAPAHYIEKNVSNGKLVSGSNSIIDLTGVATIGGAALRGAYSGANLTNFNNVDIDWSGVSSVENLGLDSCFYRRGGINSFKFGVAGGTFSNCNSMFELSDIKKCEILSSIIGGESFRVFIDCVYLTEAKLPNVTQAVGANAGGAMFLRNSRLTTLLIPNIETIQGNSSGAAMKAFCGETKITSLDMPKLETVTGGHREGSSAAELCKNCTLLVSSDMRKLTTIGDGYNTTYGCCKQMFYGTALSTMKFQSLKTVGLGGLSACFGYCSALQSVWFYALETLGSSALSNLFVGDTGVTVHFPMAIQSTYESDARFTGGFSGTNTTVLFDLVTSLTGADTNTYTRSEKDSTSTATAWTYNDTLYYTSGVSDNTNGVNEPAIGDTIYSDAACTTAVTTISAIA